MAYNYYGRWSALAGHHSPLFDSSRMPRQNKLSTASSIEYLLDRKLSLDRIALGVPLYGRAFGVGKPFATTEGAAKLSCEAYNYELIAPLLVGNNRHRYWDHEMKNPCLITDDGSEIIGYDDVNRLRSKHSGQ